jgi:hypothetical protein
MVVGMPFKDIATTDSIYLPEVPAVGDTASRKVCTSALSRALCTRTVLLDRLRMMTAQLWADMLGLVSSFCALNRSKILLWHFSNMS